MKDDWSLMAWLKRKTTAFGWCVADHRPEVRGVSKDVEKVAAVHSEVTKCRRGEKEGSGTNSKLGPGSACTLTMSKTSTLRWC